LADERSVWLKTAPDKSASSNTEPERLARLKVTSFIDDLTNFVCTIFLPIKEE
jgi:hypothetical protein